MGEVAELVGCQLQYAAGRIEACPGRPCPFWSDSRCVIAGLRSDLGGNPDLVHLLLRVRTALAGNTSLFGRLPEG